MPLRFEVDREAGLVRTTAEGQVTDADLLAHARALAATPNRPLLELADFSDRVALTISAEALRSAARLLAREDVNPPGARLALVAKNDGVFGMLRMFQAYRENENVEVAVFRDREEALAWLRTRGG